MFKVSSSVLKNIITQLVRSVKRKGIGEKTIYIRTLDDGLVSFYYHGDDISVEKKVPCEISGNLEFATGIVEIEVKVAALPDDVDVVVQKTPNTGGVVMLWGTGKRKSELRMNILPETSPMVEIPPIAETIKWKPGVLHNIVRYLPPFCLPQNSQRSHSLTALLGPNFSKDDTGRVHIRATDGVKGVTIQANHMDWFTDPMSLDASTLQGVAEVIPADAEIEVGLSGGTVVIFKAGYTTAVCRTLAGNFPDIDHAFVTKSCGKLIIDRMELIDVCRRIRILAPKAPLLHFLVKGNKVYAVVPGVLEQDLPATIDGNVPNFTINAIHLEVAAQLFAIAKRSDELTLYVNAFNKPVSVAIEGREDIKLFCMPHTSVISQEAKEKETVK
jgi:DNA polymerase-3 subunit beta